MRVADAEACTLAVSGLTAAGGHCIALQLYLPWSSCKVCNAAFTAAVVAPIEELSQAHDL